jgi:hypothetical protein
VAALREAAASLPRDTWAAFVREQLRDASPRRRREGVRSLLPPRLLRAAQLVREAPRDSAEVIKPLTDFKIWDALASTQGADAEALASRSVELMGADADEEQPMAPAALVSLVLSALEEVVSEFESGALD